MEPPRIAIISPNRKAWSETFIAAHMARLQQVALVLTDGHLPKRDQQGAPLVPAKLFDRLARRVAGTAFDDALRSRIKALLKRQRIQVVLAEYGPTGEAMLPICKELGIPLVVHFHGIDAFHHGLLKENGNYAGIFQSASAIVAVSREMEQQLLALGAPRERLHYNCYGIDGERFRPGDPGNNGPELIGLGRFVDKKAPHLLVLAFAQAAKQVPNARLTLAGTGLLWESTRQLVLALGLQDHVELPGVLAPEQVAEAMFRSRAFVQHSVVTKDNDHEGTPLAVLEAMACGLPVIATRHAGMPDVVEHGTHGLLCEERDVEGMAANMVRILTDPEVASSMGQAARERMLASFRVEDRIATLQRIIGQAVGS